MTDGKVRLALLGCGAICHYHSQALAGLDRLEVVAAIDTDLERARAVAEQHGATAFASLDQALEDVAFDAVDVMLPHHLHEDAALAVLAAGRHLLLEKPLATTLAACERIIAAAKASGRVFLLGENAQYWHEARAVAELVREGRIGEIISVAGAAFFNPVPGFFDEGGWRFSEAIAGGGIAIDGGLHELRCLRMWLGEMAAVAAVTGRPTKRMEGASLVRALFRSETGVPVSLDLLLTDAPLGARDRFRLTGTLGELVMDDAGVRLIMRQSDGAVTSELAVESRPDSYMIHSFRSEFDDFADAILCGAPVIATPESGMMDVRLALAIERAAQEQRWVSIDEL
jgi:UDP-N-acetyl-2-amino-2-deoxyglucuronate dehydrogenase